MSGANAVTVTFLFTDIEGSTQLWEQHPDAMRDALACHDLILRASIEEHGGRVFKTLGDGFCAAFSRAPDALAAALEAQRRLAAANAGVGAAGEERQPALRLRVRAALHTDTAEERGGDYLGAALSRVARLVAAGHGDQTLLSQSTERWVRDALPEGAGLRDLGRHRLRDLSGTEQVFQLTHPELPAEFPPLRSVDQFPNNLPVELNSFIGRERETQEIAAALTGGRLLTLLGAGGSGKTRLALQVGADLLELYPDGVWLVELAGLTDPALAPQAVATALRVREEPGRSVTDALVEFLGAKTLLLILDNCEHLVGACADLVSALLRACRGLTVLATSREVLGVEGEVARQVPALSLPPESAGPEAPAALDPDALLRSEAIRLFVDRAAAVRPGFALSAQNAAAVVRICRRLDGIPLALELAAARVKMLPVEAIAARLEDCFRLLTGGSRTAMPRQQTLRAALDWSYDLLSDPERELLRRLSVFAGHWSLAAAESICSGGDVPEEEVLDLLTALADKSLVLVEEGAGEALCYRLLEMVRQYGRLRLAETGEEESVRERHRDWYLALAETAEPGLQGAEQAVWLECLERDHGNIRAALEWSLRSPAPAGAADAALRLAGAVWRFWYLHGHFTEGRRWLEAALARGSGADRGVRARALSAVGNLAWAQGDLPAAHRFHSESLELFRELQDLHGIARALNNLGLVARFQDDTTSARVYLEQSLAIYREMGDRARVATLLGNLGALANSVQDYTRAQSLLEESLALHRELGDQLSIAATLHNLGKVADERGDAPKAVRLFQESLLLRRELGDARGAALSLLALAVLVGEQGDVEHAVRLLGAADAAQEAIGAGQAPLPERDARIVDDYRQKLHDPRLALAWEQGRALSLDEAVEEASAVPT